MIFRSPRSPSPWRLSRTLHENQQKLFLLVSSVHNGPQIRSILLFLSRCMFRKEGLGFGHTVKIWRWWQRGCTLRGWEASLWARANRGQSPPPPNRPQIWGHNGGKLGCPQPIRRPHTCLGGGGPSLCADFGPAATVRSKIFFEKETAPASASIDVYGYLLKLNHNELTKIIYPKTPKPPHNTYTPDHERKTCQHGLIPGRHTNPSYTRNRETSHTPRLTK
jgi:hypothetical protein